MPGLVKVGSLKATRVAGGSGWTPASLNPEVWLNFNDASPMFTDQAGTTPVSVNNDPILRADDLTTGKQFLTLSGAPAGSPAYKVKAIRGINLNEFALADFNGDDMFRQFHDQNDPFPPFSASGDGAIGIIYKKAAADQNFTWQINYNALNQYSIGFRQNFAGTIQVGLGDRVALNYTNFTLVPDLTVGFHSLLLEFKISTSELTLSIDSGYDTTIGSITFTNLSNGLNVSEVLGTSPNWAGDDVNQTVEYFRVNSAISAEDKAAFHAYALANY